MPTRQHRSSAPALATFQAGLDALRPMYPLRSRQSLHPSYDDVRRATGVVAIPFTAHSPERVEQPGVQILNLPKHVSRIIPDSARAEAPKFNKNINLLGYDDAYKYRDRFRSLVKYLRAVRGVRALLADAHASQLEKWIPEEGHPTAAYARGRTVCPPSLERIPKEYFALLASTVRNAPSETDWPLRRGSNHSGPTWGRDDFDHAIHLAMSAEVATSWTSVERVWRDAFAIMAPDANGVLTTTPCLTGFQRIQGSRKRTSVIEATPDGLISVGTAAGFYPRARQVNGVPTYINEALRPAVMRATTAVKKRFTWLKHTTPTETLRKITTWVSAVGKTAQIYSDDASSFDESVDEHALSSCHEVLGLLDPRYPSLGRSLATAPMITGPQSLRERARLVQRQWTMASGRIDTSLFDSWINAGVVLNCVRRASRHTFDAIREVATSPVGWGPLVQGDDTLLVLPAEMDEDAYTAHAKAHGFERKLERYPIFLMTWYDVDRQIWHGLASRAAFKTVTRERAEVGPATALFGAYVRWERCVADPFFDECWQAIKDCRLFTAFSVSSFASLRATVAHPSFRAHMEEEVATAPQGAERWADLIASLAPSNELSDYSWSDLLTPELARLYRDGWTRARAVSSVLEAGGWRKALAKRVRELEKEKSS